MKDKKFLLDVYPLHPLLSWRDIWIARSYSSRPCNELPWKESTARMWRVWMSQIVFTVIAGFIRTLITPVPASAVKLLRTYFSYVSIAMKRKSIPECENEWCKRSLLVPKTPHEMHHNLQERQKITRVLLRDLLAVHAVDGVTMPNLKLV